MHRLRWVPVLMLAMLGPVLVACGHGNGVARKAASVPAATTTTAGAPVAASAPAGIPTLAPDLVATLKKYALAQGDLPSGYSLGVEQELPNETASQGFADPAAVVKEIQKSGRQGGLAQQVFTTTSASELGVTIEAFKDAAGAQDWVAHAPSYPASLNATPATLPQPLGEQSSVFHWTQNGSSGYIVNFRRGRIVFGLGLSAPTGQESLATLMPIAKSLDAKALKQSN